MTNRKNIAIEFANAIKSEDIKQIILFGSVARGEDNYDSDIDILIVSDYMDKIWPNISKEIAWFLYDKQELISAHVMSVKRFNNDRDHSFLANILEEGVKIG